MRRPFRCLLDANVIAKPVTRSLLMIGAERSGFVVGWSAYAEREADRHLAAGGRKVSASGLRQKFELELWPAGDASAFSLTDPKDRQVLADAVAAKARFVITEDVDDFAEAELVKVGVAAVHPDLFMARRLTPEAYRHALELMCLGRTRPPDTIEGLHAAINRHHPMLFAAHRELFDVVPEAGAGGTPGITYRGARCLVCGTKARHVSSLLQGVCSGCR